MGETAQSRMTEYSDRRVWDLKGLRAVQINIAFTFDIICLDTCSDDNDNEVFIRIENTFTYKSPNRITSCHPEDIDSIKEAISVLRFDLDDLTAFRDGRLQVRFIGGQDLQVKQHFQFESWEAHGRGKFRDLALLCSSQEGPPWSE